MLPRPVVVTTGALLLLGCSGALTDLIGGGSATFGTGHHGLELLGRGTEFERRTPISVRFDLLTAIGATSATLAIYQVDGEVEQSVSQLDLKTDPSWGVLVYDLGPVDSPGKYRVRLNKSDGTLATGDFSIR